MFHFTIRDLLWLMVVVGLACRWLADRRELKWNNGFDVHRMQRIGNELENVVGMVEMCLDNPDWEADRLRLRQWARVYRANRDREVQDFLRQSKSAYDHP